MPILFIAVSLEMSILLIFVTLREKYPNMKFSGSYFPVFGINMRKYGTKVTQYLDIFQAASRLRQVFRVREFKTNLDKTEILG